MQRFEVPSSSIPSQSEKPIPLMGVLQDAKIRDRITQLATGFGMPSERIQALIQRESGGNPQERSRTGSRGLMQLTSSVFDDFATHINKKGKVVGRGMREYLDDFRQISQETLDELSQQLKYREFVVTIREIQVLDPREVQRYALLVTKLRTITETTTALGDPYPNLVIGAMYLSSIQDRTLRATRMAKEGNGDAQKSIASIIRKSQGASLAIVNNMLTEKLFRNITQEDLTHFLHDTFSDTTKTANFLSFYHYNGDATKDKNGTEHRIHYAIAMSISEGQMIQSNRKAEI